MWVMRNFGNGVGKGGGGRKKHKTIDSPFKTFNGSRKIMKISVITIQYPFIQARILYEDFNEEENFKSCVLKRSPR